MSVIQVNAIVSVSGTETSVTVGDITYEAEQGCQSLSEAVGAGAKSILIDGVTCTGVAINGVTVIGVNGAMIAEGSVINASGTNVVSDMAFVGNTTGGIYLSSGSLNISGGSFLNNRAGNGGAIYNHRGTMTVTDVYFSGNSVGNAGGAIRNEWRMTIGGATFVGNIGNQGAAIYNGGTITIVDKLTLGASQTIRSEGTIYIKADSFISPSAEGVQCALVVDGVSSSWREDRGSAQWITDDGYELVTAYAGDLYVTDADADHIVANTTIVSVGGTAAVAAVGDTLYYGPQSESFGLGRKNTALVDFYYTGRAAVNYSGADRTIVGSGDSGIRDSHSSGQGGALFFYKYADVNYRIEGLKFIDNSSTRGGAVVLEGGTLAVVDCVFSGNTCNGLGGAIYRDDGILTVSGSTFTGNTSSENGGAVMHDNAVQGVTISNSLFTGNRSASTGGALHSRGGMVSGSTFRNNLGSGGASIWQPVPLKSAIPFSPATPPPAAAAAPSPLAAER
ncbi:MAG: hypothetical protein MR051_08590 [Lentisphaeria bacterium]|nr:hypothetical protein [Lentisphaeria bacterium]